jgi:hypothetical protein
MARHAEERVARLEACTTATNAGAPPHPSALRRPPSPARVEGSPRWLWGRGVGHGGKEAWVTTRYGARPDRRYSHLGLIGGAKLSESKIRIVALIAYVAALSALQWRFIDTGLAPNENSVWFYSGLASLLFGSRLLNPYFTPPADVLTNAFAAFLALIPALSAHLLYPDDHILLNTAVYGSALLGLSALLVIITRPGVGHQPSALWQSSERIVRGLGSPHILFTAVVLAAVWLFHRDKPVEVFTILAALAVIVIGQPIEAVFGLLSWMRAQPSQIKRADIVGVVAAHQSPGIVLIRQSQPTTVPTGTAMIIYDQHGPDQLGVALNYVGRDEGNLLRTLTTKLPQSLQPIVGSLTARAGDGLAVSIVIPEEDVDAVPALRWIARLCGIVDVDSSPEHLHFEVIDDSRVKEGALVEVRIGAEARVIYQVVDGVTREEIVQQKNKYGYARAKARKIGRWDDISQKFEPVSWMPKLNAPVFLLQVAEEALDEACVGRFPSTSYGVRVDVSELVTHNTAVLGILGVGKSYLSIELVERMIAQGIKVVCIDLTNQYESLLEDFIDLQHSVTVNGLLEIAGHGGVAHKNKELGGSKQAFKREVWIQMQAFMTPADDHYLWVINPAQFKVTKQISGMFNNDADLSHMTAAEITSIFSDAALAICQQMGMTDEARLCLVYEEAHSLVPEWNSVASEGDRLATATSARAILQGRKYGLGCLLVTQRTANVTKTILNQCNTIFAMRTFDDTGKEFLGNYIGSDYASALPSLQPRHAVVFGKGSSCENPVLIRLNDQAVFRAAFRGENPPRRPTPIAVRPVDAPPEVL